MHYRRICGLLVVLLLCLAPGSGFAQNDPISLQTRAIQRIDGFVDQFRRTGDMRSRLRDLAEAATELDASNQAFAVRGAWADLALGLIKKGHIYRMQGQWPQSIALYEQAEEAAKRGRHVAHQADALAWKGLAESSRRNVGQAFAAATEAVRLAETIDDTDVLARALNVLGTAQIAQRDLAAAAHTSEREIAVALRAKDPFTPYYAYLNRSDLYLKSGEKCDFQRSFEPCYQAFDRARADLQQALTLARKLGYSGLARQTEGMMDNVEASRSLVKSQERMHQNVQKVNIFHPKKAGDVVVTESFVTSWGQIPPLLARLYDDSKRMQKQAGGFADVSEARSQFLEGMMSQAQGNHDAALVSFLKAVDTLEGDRRALRDERSRGTFLEDRINFYYAPIQQLLERRCYDESFLLFERSRSRAFADLLASRRLDLDRPEEQKLYAESTVLRTRIADAQSRLFEIASQSDAVKNAAQTTNLQAQIRSLEGQHRQVVSRMAVESPRLQNLVVSAPATLGALQQSMRTEHYEVLQYLVLEHGVIVWHIAPDSVFVRNVFLPRSEVIGKVAALQKSLANSNATFDETTAQELFLFLIQPVLSRIRSERLVIMPHEDLHYVPFQVFKNPADGHYLGERFQITYAPSASVLLGLSRSPGLSGARLLAVADPTMEAAVPEVQAIGKLFPGRNKLVVDSLARESDIKTWVRDFDIIHLAVHGAFDAGEPMLSHLALARGSADDGQLTAAEMFGLPLNKSRLVVLSACVTGRAEATHGNEVLGMVRALMYAGAGTLVLSHWEVNSAATALWMQTFYEAAQSRPLQEAARLALVKVKSDPAYSHPFFWAAFTMIGR